MKVLLATSFFPPARTAGTETRTFSYARALLERGHEPQVLCVGDFEEGAPRYWKGHTDEIYQGVRVRRIHLFWQKSSDPSGYLYKNPETAAFLQRCIEQWQPDLMHITSCLTLSASIIGAAKEARLPILLTLTDFWFLCHKLSLLKYDGSLCNGITTSRECIQCLSWESGIYRKLKKVSSDAISTDILDRLSRTPFVNRLRVLRGMAINISERKTYLAQMLNLVDIITAPSINLAEIMHQSGVARNIRVIQSGHDLSWLDSAPEKSSGQRLRLGYIGQMIHSKGVGILLSAFGKTDWLGKAELHLFGSTEIEPEYWRKIQQIENCNPGSLFYHDPFPHEKVGEILAGLDVVIVPSLWHENNPRIIHEAFASRTPVIASNVGGIAEHVQHNVNGLLFRRGDSEDLRVQIRRVLEEPALLEHFKMHCPRVKSIKEEMDEFEKLYEGLLSQQETVS